MTIEASIVSATTKQDAGVPGSCVQRKFVPAPIWTEAMLATSRPPRDGVFERLLEIDLDGGRGIRPA